MSDQFNESDSGPDPDWIVGCDPDGVIGCRIVDSCGCPGVDWTDPRPDLMDTRTQVWLDCRLTDCLDGCDPDLTS